MTTPLTFEYVESLTPNRDSWCKESVPTFETVDGKWLCIYGGTSLTASLQATKDFNGGYYEHLTDAHLCTVEDLEIMFKKYGVKLPSKSAAPAASGDIDVNSKGGKQSRIAERPTLLPPKATLAVSAVLTTGAAKYGNSNWKLIDVEAHLDHAMRHILLYLANDATESHLSHAACRLLMALEMTYAVQDSEAW